jgi:hypothetical protein
MGEITARNMLSWLESLIKPLLLHLTGCLYRVSHLLPNFFNNFTTNEDIATKFEADLNSLCKKCDDIITRAGSGHHLRPDRIRIIKEMPGSIASGTLCIIAPPSTTQLEIYPTE